MDIIVEPSAPTRHDGGAYLEPSFLNAAWSFSRQIRGEQTGVREVGSVLSALDRISAESFPGRSREAGIVASRSEAAAYFTYITSGIDPKVLDEIYSENAYRLTVSFPAEGSSYTRRLQEGVETIAKEYPDLSVTFGGRMALYPSVDRYLEESQLWNFLSGDLVIILGLTLFFWIGRRSLRTTALHPLRAGICLALPFTVSSATIMLVMAFCRVPLDMATAAIGAICLNASIDFSLYLLLAYERALGRCGKAAAGTQAVTREGKVVLTDALVNTVCFLPLVGSLFLPIERLGLLVVAMLWASACSAIFLMPLALEWAARTPEPQPARLGA
jgi:predicted RND superfamily exporter protein